MCLRHKVCRLQKGMVNNMTKKQKKMLYRIIVTFLLFAVLMVCEHTGGMDGWNKIVLFVIYLVPYLVIGYDIVYKAARNISHGQVFDENFLMAVATVGAMGLGEYSEGGRLCRSGACRRFRPSDIGVLFERCRAVFV